MKPLLVAILALGACTPVALPTVPQAHASSCGSISNTDLRYYCDSNCGSISNTDLRYYCQGNYGSISSTDLRYYGQANCGSISSTDLRYLCQSGRKYPGSY